jgi:hypothetical protein
VALTITTMHAASEFYLPPRLGRASELYGAIGTTVVTLGWFFILGRVIAISLVLDAVLYERFGSISTFVFSLPVIRLPPRKSVRVRRFFDLDSSREGPRSRLGMASAHRQEPGIRPGTGEKILTKR